MLYEIKQNDEVIANLSTKGPIYSRLKMSHLIEEEVDCEHVDVFRSPYGEFAGRIHYVDETIDITVKVTGKRIVHVAEIEREGESPFPLGVFSTYTGAEQAVVDAVNQMSMHSDIWTSNIKQVTLGA